MNKKVKKKINGAIKKTPVLPGLISYFSQQRVLSYMALIAFIGIVMGSLFLSPQIFQASIHEGNIALRDVYAPYDFTYEWGVDEEATKEKEEKARAEAPYFVERDSGVENDTRDSVKDFFEKIAIAKELEEDKQKRYVVVQYPGIFSRQETVEGLLKYQDHEELKEEILSVSEKIYSRGLITARTFEELKDLSADEYQVVGEDGKIVFDQVFVHEDLEEDLTDIFRKRLSGRFDLQRASRELLLEYMRPNMVYAKEHTEKMRDKAVEETEPVLKTWSVQNKELVVSQGQRVQSKDLAALAAMSSVFRPGVTPVFFAGVFLLLLMLGLMWWVYTYFTENNNLADNTKTLTIVLLNMLFMILVSNWIIHMPQPSFFIPLAGMGMMITLLAGFHTAFIAVSVVGLIIALLFGAGIETFFVLMVSSFVGIYVIKSARMRIRIIWAGLAAGAAKFGAIVTIGLMNDMDASFFINEGLYGFASGLLSAFFVLAFLPLFEHIFKVTTGITLVEQSDLNHPLLKQLAMVAPGTYHHSILVGTLAEAACDAIGANSLRARVGAYYHDIGKIDKPEYFNENEMLGGSKHKKLTPSMSALIISQHVKKGIELAKKYKLNSTIKDFIAQHHGTSLISFFYHKAKKRTGESEKALKDQDFRYPGPRPQTKETAIVLMADSVEAATRSLKKATPASIRNQVQKVINSKFIDGQLDECDLTLRDMHEIQESFVRVLTGIYHKRLKYPKEVNNSSKKNGFSNGTNKSSKSEPKDRT